LNIVENRGWVSAEDLESYIVAGFTKQKRARNSCRHRAQGSFELYQSYRQNTPVDDAFKKFTWQNPETAAA